ncbi:DUF4114 domain-containing protein [Desulfococcaceae bacterium HSG8]|nr:DUF4114 domain-containing protein [Desulfococcaceae bacterium HSG8]
MTDSVAIPVIANCVFNNNSAEVGGGICDMLGNSRIANCTFINNSAVNGGGLFSTGADKTTVVNSIFWNNTASQISISPTVIYSLIQGGFTGEGNIDNAPLFADAENGDYRLSDSSPCIGAGTLANAPNTDVEGSSRPNPAGSKPDMGAYENVLGEPKIIKILLTVNANGTGIGTVTSTAPDAAINCGEACSASYNEGTTVTLSATPDENSTFVGWSGECTGTGDCQVTMDEAKTLTATFAKVYTVTTTATSGNGTISPSGETTLAHGDSQVFTITPKPDYRIADVLLDGEPIGAFSSYTLRNVSGNHSIEARFVPEFECSSTPTVESVRSGRWDDPGIWNPGRVPNSTDTVLIEEGHLITAPSGAIYLRGLCNHGQLRSYSSRTIYIRAETFIDNYGQIIGRDGRPGQAGSSVILYVRYGRVNNHVNGLISSGNGGSGGWSRWTWLPRRSRWTRQSNGGRGGTLSLISKYLYNRGTIRSGNGGSSWSGCPGNGGNLTLGARSVSGSRGQVIAGRRGWGNTWLCSRGRSRLRFDPNIISLAGAGTKIEGEDVTIFGGKDFVLDLTGMDTDAISADADITLAVGEGGIIDLTGSADTILKTDGQVTILSDNIMLDEGIELEDVIDAENIVTGPAQIIYNVSVTGPAQIAGEPGTTISVNVAVANGGPEADTYTLTLEDSAGWNLGELPETVTLEAFELSELTLEVTLPADIGDTDVITVRAVSQADPDTSAETEITVIAGQPDEETEPGENEIYDDFSGITDDFDTGDKDGDEMTDGWEAAHGLNPDADDASENPDRDGLSNREEFQNGTDPSDSDTDDDAIPDGWEIKHGLNPVLNDASEDPDGNGLTNLEEYRNEITWSFTAGIFTVGETGTVTIDWLYDGGMYKGELGIFSLTGMEDLEPGSPEFIEEAARRALSGTVEGYVVISDQTEGARFSGLLGESKDWNSGEHNLKTVTMRPGDSFATILVPDSTLEKLRKNPGTTDSHKRPLFSLASSNPEHGMHLGQIADINGSGNAFVYEDMNFTYSDKDYNDFIFLVTGATAEAALLDDLIEPEKDWRIVQNPDDPDDPGHLGGEIMGHADATPPEDDSGTAPPAFRMTVTLTSDAAVGLAVYDPSERVCEKVVSLIPGASFTSDNGRQIVSLTSAADGKYRFVLRGGESGVCNLTVKGYEDGAEILTDTKQSEIGAHQVLTSHVTVAFGDNSPIIIRNPEVSLKYDSDGNGRIDDRDIKRVSSKWNAECGDPEYDPYFDLDDDCYIGILDIMPVVNSKTAP